MSNLRQADEGVLVRFWSIDHHRAENVPWPISPWPKLVYAAKGTLQVESSDRLWVLPTNQALWIDAGEPHRSETLGKAQVRTLYFSPEMAVNRAIGPMEISSLLKELIVETCSSGPLIKSNPVLASLAVVLQFEVERAAAIPSGIIMPQSPWLRQWALEFLAYPLEWPECAYSRRTLERQMSKETGLTLGQWRRQARAVVGLRSLSTGSTVLEAAIEAGFASASGFIHSFSKKFGVTPGRIR